MEYIVELIQDRLGLARCWIDDEMDFFANFVFSIWLFDIYASERIRFKLMDD